MGGISAAASIMARHIVLVRNANPVLAADLRGAGLAASSSAALKKLVMMALPAAQARS